MILNDFGKIVRDEWMRTAQIRKEIEIDEFIVMPNHFHGIIFIHGRGDRSIKGQTNHIRQDRRMIGAAGRPYHESKQYHGNDWA